MRGTTTVRPRENGAGWLTCGDSEMVTVRLLVDDDLGGFVGFDLQLLDLGQHGDDLLRKFLRQRQLHGRRIERLGDRRADIVVDGDGDALCRGEVGVAQSKARLADAVEREFDLAFDDGAVRQAADGRNPARDLGGLAFGLKPPMASEPCATA